MLSFLTLSLLLTLCRCAVVYETVHETVVVTVGGAPPRSDASPAPTPTSVHSAWTFTLYESLTVTITKGQTALPTSVLSELVKPRSSGKAALDDVFSAVAEAEAEATTTSSAPRSTSEPRARTTSSPPAPARQTTQEPKPEPSKAPDAPSDFAQGLLDYHNKVRAQHGAGPLVWDATLAGFAESYLANNNCQFEHSGGPYGENLALGYANPIDAAKAWYDEKDLYDYATGGFSMATGHFTQVVWKDTSRLGCHQKQCSGRNYLVCEYASPGNVIGHFQENVLPA